MCRLTSATSWMPPFAALSPPATTHLVHCGFLDYVKALPHDGQLFPALKPGGPDGEYNHYFAKRFAKYRRSPARHFHRR